MSSKVHDADVGTDLARLQNIYEVKKESETRLNEIELSVLEWSNFGDSYVQRTPYILKLPRDANEGILYETLNGFLPSRSWGIIMTDDMRVWYVRQAQVPFLFETARQSMQTLENSIRNRQGTDMVKIHVQDLNER
jgi:hypothetical protein